jgi:peptidoglycan/xylan/chitin deacetylase (PgdA/CDA1 family)
MMRPTVALKIDVDTDVGTRDGVPRLIEILQERDLPGTFLFSLGPDNTGKAIRRIFRPGFLKKVRRTKVGSVYGWRTLLSGTLLPAPLIGKRRADILRYVRDSGYEVGVHCYDHFKWQDYVHRFDLDQTRREFGKAVSEFKRIFGEPPSTAGAPGWQANARTLQVYDEYKLLYGSDTRGSYPFFPKVNGRRYDTLQVPTTLPTLDELLGRPEYPEISLPDHYLGLLNPDSPNVWTIHAEIEGQAKSDLFIQILDKLMTAGVHFTEMRDIAVDAITRLGAVAASEIADKEIDGRSGIVAQQASLVV